MQNNNNFIKYVFFLGGYDLEMKTIRKILEENNFQENKHFFDKKLGWGAKLSAYEKELENLGNNKIPVLIELTPDKNPPENAKIIDHHNENEDKPSSLEQIVYLLNKEFNLEIKLDRWMQLVAANDKGYIPAMECLCATEKEIKEIRDADRKAQGVTEEDERLAEESIQKYKTEKNGITVIKSLTNKFSPINDRMYGKTDRLLIYNDKTLVYYGKGKNKIVETFQKEIAEGKAYQGGGISGYFGLDSGKFTNEQIINLKNKIIKMNLTDEKPISHHIFLFPFKWDINSSDEKENKPVEELNFKDRVNLVEIAEIFKNNNNFDEGIIWRSYKFTINRPRDYNEYTYFYEHITTTLFDNENKKFNDSNRIKNISFKYFLEFEPGSKYIIDIVERNSWGKPFIPSVIYELEIEDILINFYQTGIGILSFHLSNYKYNKPEQILDINDFGRRIYPQFLDDENKLNPLTSVKETFLANSITIKLKKKSQKEQKEIKDCFWSFDKPFNNINPNEIKKIPKYISTLLGKKFNDMEKDLSKNEVKISPIIDDRMFTICWYGDDNCSNVLKTNTWNKALNRYEYNYEKNKIWNRFIFVDNRSNGLASENLLTKQNIEHTYDRWIDNGTFFGISSYSFILLTDRGSYPINILLNHTQTMYFQLVMLALLQRASLIRFSDEATKVQLESNISYNKEKDAKLSLWKKLKNWLKSFKSEREESILEKKLYYITNLYKSYLQFVNKIFFREPTAQEQGIELYDMILKKMRIEQEVKDLNRELDEIHNYVSLIAQRAQTQKMDNLTVLGTVFVILSLLVSFWGLMFTDTKNIPDLVFFSGKLNLPFVTSLLIIAVLTYISIKFISRKYKIKRGAFNLFTKDTKEK